MLDQLFDPVERDEVVRLVANGVLSEAFGHHNWIIRETIHGYAKGLPSDLRVLKVRSSYSRVYLLSSLSVSGLHGLVVRIVPTRKEDLMLRAWTEATLLKEVGRTNSRFRIPQHLGSYEEREKVLFLSELLPGKPVSNVVVGEDGAIRIAEAIRYTQRSISLTPIGTRLLGLPDRHNPFCRTKVVRLFRKFCNIEIAAAKLSALDGLDVVRQKSRVVVSDRTPVNFLLDGPTVGIIDLDLILVGTPFEDWAWFINDDRLQSSLSRRELFEIFRADYQQFMDISTDELVRNFFLASIFVALKQTSMAQANVDEARKQHLLNRVEESARELSLQDVIEVVEELRSS